MSGTIEGGRKTKATLIKRMGMKAYREHKATIGAKGGRSSNTGGFYANRELARIAGAKGGRISKRTKGRGAKQK